MSSKNTQAPTIAAVVVAAGRGTRMGSAGAGGERKPLMQLAGRRLIEWTAAAFEALEHVREGVVVAHADDLATMASVLAGRALEWRVVPGGGERPDSVRRGVTALTPLAQIIAVHDAARPLVRPSDIERVSERAAELGAALLAVPVRDTLKSSLDGGFAEATLERATLWAAQTPQAFRAELLRELVERAAADGFRPTDEAALHERYVGPIAIVEGDPRNLKITTRADLEIATALLAGQPDLLDAPRRSLQ